jgi:hypothetical protein
MLCGAEHQYPTMSVALLVGYGGTIIMYSSYCILKLPANLNGFDSTVLEVIIILFDLKGIVIP